MAATTVPTIADSITRMRRFLRDPDGRIWTDAELVQYFNDAAQEIAQKTGVLVVVAASKYPPDYNYTFFHAWEQEYADGDVLHLAQTLNAWEGFFVTAPWQAAYHYSTSGPNITYEMATAPWQAWYGSCNDPIEVPLHGRLHRMLWLSYDQDYIEGVDEGYLARSDPNYKEATGTPVYYYRPDEYRNTFVPYPLPAATTWQDIFEYESILQDDSTIQFGDDAVLDDGDYGIPIDSVDYDDGFLMIFEAMPREVAYTNDTSDFPEWLVKYVEHGALERAYSADTDGFIPSLRDYWKFRKELGIEAVKRMIRMRTVADRQYVMGGVRKPGTPAAPRLPYTYPDF